MAHLLWGWEEFDHQKDQKESGVLQRGRQERCLGSVVQIQREENYKFDFGFVVIAVSGEDGQQATV